MAASYVNGASAVLTLTEVGACWVGWVREKRGMGGRAAQNQHFIADERRRVHKAVFGDDHNGRYSVRAQQTERLRRAQAHGQTIEPNSRHSPHRKHVVRAWSHAERR